MDFEGTKVRLQINDKKIATLTFDAQQSSVNKLDSATLSELQQVVEHLKTNKDHIKGLVCLSAKESFIVGADITEFQGHFKKSKQELSEWLYQSNQIFNAIEDFPFPVVSAINGLALGGGFEFTLASAFRVVDEQATVGLPEVKLGIFPGWGGTVRLPRCIGLDHALEWILTGKHIPAIEAFRVQAADAVVKKEDLQTAAYHILEQAMQGKLHWEKRQKEKKNPVALSPIETELVFATTKSLLIAQGVLQQVHILKALEVIQKNIFLERQTAQPLETEGFVEVAQSPSALALVGVFLGQQLLKKQQSKTASSSIQSVAVLGAGIMGGGIAYQAADSEFSILMKDIAQDALEKGIQEAMQLFEKQAQKKKLSISKTIDKFRKIHPTLKLDGLQDCQLVIEAVVENTEVKKKVLIEAEERIASEAILTSNTSSILITELARSLKRPDKFCGLHFFNPVPKMPLVEVIRGEKTSQDTINTAVQFAFALGKTPIVVNDCAGFLVNRILFAYFIGFLSLVGDQQNFVQIDKVMEHFGWPMGPAHLLDVIGLDTAVHVYDVMAKHYPDRMQKKNKTLLDVLFEKKLLGQKTKKGFYEYRLDKKGKPIKTTYKESLEGLVEKYSDEQSIIDRMMIPMIFESIRCLEDGIVRYPYEVDMGLILGLGFPAFRGGALRLADTIGLKELCSRAQRWQSLGALYAIPESLRKKEQMNQTFYT